MMNVYNKYTKKILIYLTGPLCSPQFYPLSETGHLSPVLRPTEGQQCVFFPPQNCSI